MGAAHELRNGDVHDNDESIFNNLIPGNVAVSAEDIFQTITPADVRFMRNNHSRNLARAIVKVRAKADASAARA